MAVPQSLPPAAPSAGDAERALAEERLFAVGAAASSLAHELNNPLSSIIGNLEFAQLQLEEQALPVAAELRELLAEGLAGTERLRALLAELRTLTPDANVRSADPAAAVHYAERLAKARLRERARVFQVLSPTPAASCGFAELVQWTQAVLLDAVRGVPAGEPSAMAIRIRTSASADDRLAIEVTDDRPGASEVREVSAAVRAIAARLGGELELTHPQEALDPARPAPAPCVSVRLTLRAVEQRR